VWGTRECKREKGRIRVAAITGLISFLAMAHCSLFVDTSGLSDGPADASSNDALASADALTESGPRSDAATPPMLVQKVGSPRSATQSIDLNLPNAIGVGSLVVVCVAATDDFPVSVSGGGLKLTMQAMSGAHVATSVWTAIAGDQAGTGVTVTWNASQITAAAQLSEWSGALGTSTNTTTSDNSSTLTAGTITVNANDLVLAVAGMHLHTVSAPANGFSLLDSVSADDMQLLTAFDVASAAGDSSTSWIASSADGWDSILIAFH
jgi:hypothetical protein